MNWLRPNPRRNDEGQVGPVTSLQTQMNRLFNSFFDDWSYGVWPVTSMETWGPAMDIEETTDEFIVTAELPGVDPKDVEITAVGNGVLTLTLPKREEAKPRTIKIESQG